MKMAWRRLCTSKRGDHTQVELDLHELHDGALLLRRGRVFVLAVLRDVHLVRDYWFKAAGAVLMCDCGGAIARGVAGHARDDGVRHDLWCDHLIL